MAVSYNVYCDESCHLEHDAQKAMVLGAVWCPSDKAREIGVRIREIKRKHGFPASFEVKWTKVSPSGLALYLDLIDYFFDDDDLHFRALVVPDKSILRHAEFGQTHDDWYHKMYFAMLKAILNPDARYYIYLDLKDTRGSAKVAKLHEVISNSLYDFSRQIVVRIQSVRSHEVVLVQLADLLVGVLSYANRDLDTSKAKAALVARVRARSHYSLRLTTLYRESKVNLLRWHPCEEHK
ncbi:MAG: DUF3800 domain-containing protein [Anaerolineae bacterium]|nr:DUF3800 domain-containing protein [Anaerolineae bacterium]